MLLYKTGTVSAEDYAELQQDIDQIYGWSAANLMTFNVSKYKCMLVSRRRNAQSTYESQQSPTVDVQCYKVLGITAIFRPQLDSPYWNHMYQGFWACHTVNLTTTPTRRLWQNSIYRLWGHI